MRSNEILDLKFMKVRTIEDVLSVDTHMALYDALIKFTDSPILRRMDDKFLCDVGNHVVIDGCRVRILDINPITYNVNVVRLTDKVLLDYCPNYLKLLGFTLDNEPILEYNV